MWSIYRDIGWRMLVSLFNVLDGGPTLTSIAIWATSYNPSFVKWIESNTGLSQKWLWIPLGCVVLHLLFKAIHERNKEWADALVAEVVAKATEASSAGSQKLLEQREHLSALRGLLSQQADEGDSLLMWDHYDPAQAKRWAERVGMIFKGSLGPDKANAWPTLAEMPEPGQLTSRIVFLRSLIVQLRIEDLKR